MCIRDRYTAYLQDGGERVYVDTISATAVKKDIHEISCSLMIHYKRTDMSGEDKPSSGKFYYKLRPTLDSGPNNFIAIAKFSPALIVHVRWGKEQQEIQREIESTSTDYPDDCQFTLQGQHVGGQKCRMITTEEGTVLASNEIGTAILKSRFLGSGKTWLAYWKRRGGEAEGLGIVKYDDGDECIKNEIFSFC